MEGQGDNKATIREMNKGMMFSIFVNNEIYYVTHIIDQGIIRLMGCGLVQAFDNIERKPLDVFCSHALENKDLHLLAFERMGNEVDKSSMLEDLKNSKGDLGRILYNRIIRFVENSACRPKQFIQKIKLLVGVHQYEILRKLHFEVESAEFSKSLDVFYRFSKEFTK